MYVDVEEIMYMV